MVEIDGKVYLILKKVYEVRHGWWGLGGHFPTKEEAEKYRDSILPGENYPPIQDRFIVVEPSEFAAIAVGLQNR